MVRKPSLTFSMIFVAVVNLLLIGCNDKPLLIEFHSTSSESENTSSWDFSEATDYIYDPEKIEFVGGKAQLKQVDQTHEGNDFTKGTHVGTALLDSEGPLVLRKNGSSSDEESLHLNSLFPSLSANLIGYWRFDEDYEDKSGKGNHGTATGTSLNSFSRVGRNSAYFSANGQRIVVQNSDELDGMNALTTGAWVWLETRDAFDQLISKCSDNSVNTDISYRLTVDGGSDEGYLLVRDQAQSNHYATTPSAGVWTGRWIHLVGRYDGAEVSYFVDGFKVGSQSAFTGTIASFNGADNNLVIGHNCYLTQTANTIRGYIDEAFIYNTPLSDAQILSLYRAQASSDPANTALSSSWTPHYDKLVGYWKMDGNWLDSSGNGYHGSPNGNATFDLDSKIGGQSGSFDGNGDYVSMGSADITSFNEITLMAWVKKTAGDSRIIAIRHSGGDDIRLYLRSVYAEMTLDDGTAYVASVSGIEQTRDEQWHHYAGVYKDNLLSLYIDGVLVSSAVGGSGFDFSSASGEITIGAAFNLATDHAGEIDESAIFSVGLNNSDIKLIYERQKQRYAGHYESPVIDLGASGSWTNLDVVTPLPFGKEIVAGTAESLLDYTSLSGELIDSLVGLWHFEESNWDGTANEIRDSSGNGNHGQARMGANTHLDKILGGSSGLFDGVDDYISIPHDGTLDFGIDDFTVSSWVYLTTSGATVTVLAKTGGGAPLYRMNITSGNLIRCTINDGGTAAGIDSTLAIKNGVWHHIACSFDRDGNAQPYLDGEVAGPSVDISSVGNISNGSSLQIGSFSGTGTFFPGKIDEVALWSRLLAPGEIKQLYRRGANRIKYQVKSCVDSACECKSFNTAPVGNANDCDGDGTPNSADNDDIYKAEFVGPGGSGVTAFSELFNRDAGSMTFTCNTNTTDSDNEICVDDEITLSGNSKSSSPSFSFFDFPLSSRPLDNRYFQYRVLMEAEGNTACDGEPCLPELTSIEIGPTGRYYSGSPSVVNKTGEPLDSALNSLKVTNSSGCNLSYQISNDGNNFYYWDGASWMTGSDVTQSNDLTTMNSNISSFTEQVGLGDFYFKSFLGNSNFGMCELDELQVGKAHP